MAFNQGCKGLVPAQPVDIRFFRYQLSAMESQLQSFGQGSTFLELSADDLASVKVTVPPLFLQSQIADYLDAETARIDALISKKRRLIDLLAEYRTALITQTVTKGLPPHPRHRRRPPLQSPSQTHRHPLARPHPRTLGYKTTWRCPIGDGWRRNT